MIARRCLVTLALISSMLTWSPTITASGSASGGTTVSVTGDTVNVNVNIDLVLNQYANGQSPLSDADRQKFGGLASAISDYWNAGLAGHLYHGCLKLHVNVAINLLLNNDHVTVGYPFDSSEVGHHLIHWYPNLQPYTNAPNGGYLYTYSRPTVYDPTRPRGVPGDFPSPYNTGLPGDWSPTMGTTRDFAHEVGHLMGLDDDYRDVDNGDGTWSSQSIAGREGTLMDSGDAIDQNLVDRMGDVIGKAGIQLPTCWTGTMTLSGFSTNPGDGSVCTDPSTDFAIKFASASDGAVQGDGSFSGAQTSCEGIFAPLVEDQTDGTFTIAGRREGDEFQLGITYPFTGFLVFAGYWPDNGEMKWSVPVQGAEVHTVISSTLIVGKFPGQVTLKVDLTCKGCETGP